MRAISSRLLQLTVLLAVLAPGAGLALAPPPGFHATSAFGPRYYTSSPFHEGIDYNWGQGSDDLGYLIAPLEPGVIHSIEKTPKGGVTVRIKGASTGALLRYAHLFDKDLAWPSYAHAKLIGSSNSPHSKNNGLIATYYNDWPDLSTASDHNCPVIVLLDDHMAPPYPVGAMTTSNCEGDQVFGVTATSHVSGPFLPVGNTPGVPPHLHLGATPASELSANTLRNPLIYVDHPASPDFTVSFPSIGNAYQTSPGHYQVTPQNMQQDPGPWREQWPALQARVSSSQRFDLDWVEIAIQTGSNPPVAYDVKYGGKPGTNLTLQKPPPRQPWPEILLNQLDTIAAFDSSWDRAKTYVAPREWDGEGNEFKTDFVRYFDYSACRTNPCEVTVTAYDVQGASAGSSTLTIGGSCAPTWQTFSNEDYTIGLDVTTNGLSVVAGVTAESNFIQYLDQTCDTFCCGYVGIGGAPVKDDSGEWSYQASVLGGSELFVESWPISYNIDWGDGTLDSFLPDRYLCGMINGQKYCGFEIDEPKYHNYNTYGDYQISVTLDSGCAATCTASLSYPPPLYLGSVVLYVDWGDGSYSTAQSTDLYYPYYADARDMHHEYMQPGTYLVSVGISGGRSATFNVKVGNYSSTRCP